MCTNEKITHGFTCTIKHLISLNLNSVFLPRRTRTPALPAAGSCDISGLCHLQAYPAPPLLGRTQGHVTGVLSEHLDGVSEQVRSVMSSKLRLAVGAALATKSTVLLARICARISTELWNAPIEAVRHVLDDVFEALESESPDFQASAVALLASCISHAMKTMPSSDIRGRVEEILHGESDTPMLHVVATLATAEPLFTQDAQVCSCEAVWITSLPLGCGMLTARRRLALLGCLHRYFKVLAMRRHWKLCKQRSRQ